MSVPVGGATKVVGLVGGPRQVLRSRSPAIHNAAFHALGLDWVYVAFPVQEGDAAAALTGLVAAGVRGLNVTMPHKLAAAEIADRLEGAAAAIGSVNTIEVRGRELVGWSTDGEGLLRYLGAEGVEVAGARAVVAGAGGSARAVVAALAGAGAAGITVLARDPARAETLRALAGAAAFRAGRLPGDEAVAAAGLVVNATPVGQEGEEPPLRVDALRGGAVVVDLVYEPAETALVLAARERGARAFGGLGMLVHQGALAFEIWTGCTAPLGAMWEGAWASRS